MIHIGFAVFFMLSLLAGLVALVRAAADNMARIKSALGGVALVEERGSEVKLRVRPTADVPRIARRLAVRFPEGLAPVRHVPRAWPFEREDPSFG